MGLAHPLAKRGVVDVEELYAHDFITLVREWGERMSGVGLCAHDFITLVRGEGMDEVRGYEIRGGTDS